MSWALARRRRGEPRVRAQCHPGAMGSIRYAPGRMATPTYIEHSRRRLRKPIRTWEIQHLENLAAELRALRQAAGLNRPALAALSDVASETIKGIEFGKARTRWSTLDRISQALAHAQPQLGSSEAVLTQLVRAAGPALAPESKYSGRVESRRLRRARKGRYLPKRSKGLLVMVIERPEPGDTPKSFLARMEQRGEGYVCLHCGRAAIGLHPPDSRSPLTLSALGTRR